MMIKMTASFIILLARINHLSFNMIKKWTQNRVLILDLSNYPLYCSDTLLYSKVPYVVKIH